MARLWEKPLAGVFEKVSNKLAWNHLYTSLEIGDASFNQRIEPSALELWINCKSLRRFWNRWPRSIGRLHCEVFRCVSPSPGHQRPVLSRVVPCRLVPPSVPFGWNTTWRYLKHVKFQNVWGVGSRSLLSSRNRKSRSPVMLRQFQFKASEMWIGLWTGNECLYQ